MTDRPFEYQIKFSQFHKYLYGFIFIYLIERFTHGFNITVLLPIMIALPILSLDLFFASKHFYNQIKIVSILRLVEATLTLFLMFLCVDSLDLAVALVCYILFAVEFLLIFDFYDYFYRFISLVSLIGPIVLFIVIDAVVDLTGSTYNRFFQLFILFTLILTSLFLICSICFKAISNLNNKVFSQDRLIQNVNKVNEELRIHQEKVKKANELLGIQKIKLEAANNRIKSVNAEMMIQTDIIKYISSSLEIEKIMTLITEALYDEMGLNMCAIILSTKDESMNKKYKVKTRLGEDFNKIVKDMLERIPIDEIIVGYDSFIDNRVQHEKYSYLHKSINSLLIVPLVRNGKKIGVLLVGHKKYDYFKENVTFFESIVAQFLIAYDNAKMYERMEYMAIRDGLTGVYNRGYLAKVFNEYIEAAVRNMTPLTVALLDIDKFKNVNDTYGHLFGDEVIKSIAKMSADAATKCGGMVGRYGGEEFVIVFANKSLDEVLPSIKELHNKIKVNELTHNGKSIYVRVSMGITAYPETCKNPGELFNRADWAMYYSKQHGRDQITIDSDEIRDSVMIK